MDTSATVRAIIAAADRLVQRAGVARLTIEAVAREAGLSKGGVLYHFPSKQALVEAMIGTLLAGFDADVRRRMAADADDVEPAGHFLRAYVRASSQGAPGLDDTSAGLIAALATDGDLMEPVRRRYAAWQREAETDGLAPATATLIRLAADGLWFADLLGLASPTGAARDDVIAALLALAHPGHAQRSDR